MIDSDFVLDHNHLISNEIHLHEPPIKSTAIEILHISENLLVVDKPSSIPVL